MADSSTESVAAAAVSRPVAKFSFDELRTKFPSRRPHVVAGLCRRGEVVDLVSHAKVGKSWLAYSLVLSIVTGQRWLDTFDCVPGRVLLIDNELHCEEISHRIPIVADALGINPSRTNGLFDVWSLRGNLRTIPELLKEFDDVEAGHYSAIVLDAKYRFGSGSDENCNTGEAEIYNRIDELAERTGAAVVLVHHTSKGSQSDKRVVDVGAGAGSQSRAADTHLVLRQHQRENCAVLEAEVRSSQRPNPVTLKWKFPLWLLDPTLDPRELHDARKQKQSTFDEADSDKLLTSLTATPRTVRELSAATKIKRNRLNTLLDGLVTNGLARETIAQVKGKPAAAWVRV